MLLKSQALYCYHPDVNYVCGTCAMSKKIDAGTSGCAWYGPGFKISLSRGSCGYYAHGDPSQKFDVPWMSLFTPVELGYEENRNGFACKRCEEFVVGKDGCKEVDKNSPGDTPGTISPNGCCSIWKKDPRRGEMTDDQLIKVIGSKPRAIFVKPS